MAEIRPADSQPTPGPGFLGVQHEAAATHFGVGSDHADRVALCLFDEEGARERERFDLERRGDGTWSISLEGIAPGQLYGYRAWGPHDPHRALWFDANKLLVDPGARALHGRLVWSDALLARNRQEEGAVDLAASVPKAVVVDSRFDWQGVAAPATTMRDTVLYECHVRGTTMLHPDVGPAHRGRFLGLCQPAMIEHFQRLGITALELLPVAHFESERHLCEQGLSNYWGYSPLGWFAPHAGYATGSLGEQVLEFKTMVRELHRAGIEVVLDVVYNHTVEGGIDGTSVFLRGLDGPAYYRHDPANGWPIDWTGCGNTVDSEHPQGRRLILDSLRYWVEEMHVDGFRFDLATTLARDGDDVLADGSLIHEIAADPVLSRVKLIAEPWDLGPHGYQGGNFPAPFAEWNDQYRDTLRGFWRGDPGLLEGVRDSFEGSPHRFRPERRGATSSVNYVTSHDGFTLEDWVTYEQKNNWANGEANVDGTNHNLSRNWGVEGPSDAPPIRAVRRRTKKNVLATLALSRGVPMLSHGDELGRTQDGNNNAYCHDGTLTWIDWQHLDEELLDFCRRLFRLRATLRGFLWGDGDATLTWRPRSGGGSATAGHEERTALALWSQGSLTKTPEGGPRLVALALNGGDRPHLVKLPRTPGGGPWHRWLDTADAPIGGLGRRRSVRLVPHSLALFADAPCPVPETEAEAEAEAERF